MKEIIFRAETDLEVINLIKKYISMLDQKSQVLRPYVDVFNEANPIGTKCVLIKPRKGITLGKEYEIVKHGHISRWGTISFYIKNDNGNNIEVISHLFKGINVPDKIGTFDEICLYCKSPLSY